MFDIVLTEELVTEPASEGTTNAQGAYGNICIEGYQDTFIADLSYWSRAQYEQQWIAAAQRLLGNASHSVMITSFVPPPRAAHARDFLVWWPLYREGDVVYVQNQLLFFKQLSEPFSTSRPWDSVRPRQTVNAEGFEISEWRTTTESIREYLKGKLGGRP